MKEAGDLQHVKLAEICVHEPSLLIHQPHLLDDLQVELTRFGFGQRCVL